MPPEKTSAEPEVRISPFVAADVAAILAARNWMVGDPSPNQLAWCERAAALLGPHVSDRPALADLLVLVFHYNASEVLTRVDSHITLSRYGAREVVRQLALLLLEGAPLTSERFKEIVAALKDNLELRGRELFHPLRLSLAGRAGEGELDRVILLLDEAAALSFRVPVKSARTRILEFCAALD